MRDPKARSGTWDVVDATGLVLGSNDGRQDFLCRPDKGVLECRGGHCQSVKHEFFINLSLNMNGELDSEMSHMALVITDLQLGGETRCPYRCPDSNNSVEVEGRAWDREREC
jgi:hypothetical protein